MRIAPLDSRRRGAYIDRPDYNSNTASPNPRNAVPIALPPPQVLEIIGGDAIAFAHAQFASDVRALANEHWQWSAWLSPQGRVRAFFRLARINDEHLLLILQGGEAETLRAGLAPFVFRAKVQMHVIEPRHATGFERLADVIESLGAAPGATDVVITSGRIGMVVPGLEPRWYVLAESQPAAAGDGSPAALNRWSAADIAAGIVEVNAELSDRFLPTWLGLDRLGAISVGKGCYPGQEIVARLHFKGGNKRWLHRLAFSAVGLPVPCTSLASDADSAVGQLLRAAWTGAGQGVALAVLPAEPRQARIWAPDMPGASFRVLSTIGGPND